MSVYNFFSMSTSIECVYFREEWIMETGNVSKRQPPNKIAENRTRLAIRLQRSKYSEPGGWLQIAPKQDCILVQHYGRHTELRNT